MIIRNFAPNRPFCGCCASRAWGWITMPGPSWPWRSRCDTRRSSTRRSCARRACCWTSKRPTGRRCWGSRCAWLTRLSAGTKDLLAGTRLQIEGSRLVLRLRENSGVFAGESVIRRLERLAQAFGLQAAAEWDLDGGSGMIRQARAGQRLTS